MYIFSFARFESDQKQGYNKKFHRDQPSGGGGTYPNRFDRRGDFSSRGDHRGEHRTHHYRQDHGTYGHQPVGDDRCDLTVVLVCQKY